MIAEASSSQFHEEILILSQGETFATTEAILPQTILSYMEPMIENLDKVKIDPEFPDMVTFIRAHLTLPLHEEIIRPLWSMAFALHGYTLI